MVGGRMGHADHADGTHVRLAEDEQLGGSPRGEGQEEPSVLGGHADAVARRDQETRAADTELMDKKMADIVKRLRDMELKKEDSTQGDESRQRNGGGTATS